MSPYWCFVFVYMPFTRNESNSFLERNMKVKVEFCRMLCFCINDSSPSSGNESIKCLISAGKHLKSKTKCAYCTGATILDDAGPQLYCIHMASSGTSDLLSIVVTSHVYNRFTYQVVGIFLWSFRLPLRYEKLQQKHYFQCGHIHIFIL